MTTQLEPQESITIADEPVRREDIRRMGVLLLVGDPFGIAPQRGSRVVEFDTSLHIGRRLPTDSSARAWVVRDQLVSGQHFSIEKDGDGYKLHDLGSRNGTAVDGQLVKEPTRLRDGSLIFFGLQVAVFRTATDIELAAIQADLDAPLGPVPTSSPEFASVCHTLRKLAPSDCEILLTGETGVGKEVYARAVHDL